MVWRCLRDYTLLCRFSRTPTCDRQTDRQTDTTTAYIALAWRRTVRIDRSHGGSGPLFNTRFLEPTGAQNLNGISIGSAVLAGLTTVTDHATRSVTIGSIYVRSTAMRPKTDVDKLERVQKTATKLIPELSKDHTVIS